MDAAGRGSELAAIASALEAADGAIGADLSVLTGREVHAPRSHSRVGAAGVGAAEARDVA